MATKVRDIDRGYKKIIKTTRGFDGLQIVVGLQGEEGGAIHPDSEITTAGIGTIQEFGLGVPERSFLRSTFDENVPKWTRQMEDIAGKVYDGSEASALRAAGILGEVASSDVKEKIASGVPPPNAPSTIARKGSATTLIDLGLMRQSVTWKIKKR